MRKSSVIEDSLHEKFWDKNEDIRSEHEMLSAQQSEKNTVIKKEKK